jgi:hypothetical protein
MRHLFLLALLPVAAAAQVSFGTASLMDDHWAFSLGDNAKADQTEFNDHTWRRVDLPHDWSIEAAPSEKLASCTGYLPGGIGWYRKTLNIPTQVGGEKVFLYFEGIYNRSDVYINGHLLGKRPNGFVSFVYDATPFVKFDGENTVAVRVDHHLSADSRWYTGSGINRNVFLIRSGFQHIAPFGVFVQAELGQGEDAHLRIATELQNEADKPAALTVRHEILSDDDRILTSTTSSITLPAKGADSVSMLLDLAHARRWSLDDPYLYRVRTTVLRDGKVIDQTTTRTGLRQLSFDANTGFALNGVPTKMKGVCVHDDAGVLGTAVPPEVWRQRLLALKEVGCNAIRVSHNPHAPEVYDLCDEVGLLVLDEAFDEWEFPKRKWLVGWNVGEPGFEGDTDYFAEWSSRDVADMVRRDRNHPCVFAWSIGNEVDFPNDPYSHPVLDQVRINQPMQPGYLPDHPNANRLSAIAKRLVKEVKEQDQTRPVTAALAGVVMSNETEYPGMLDIAGYNYTEERYAIDHQKYPQRILYGSENVQTLKAWRAVVENNYVFGQFIWTGIDYLGESGPWPARGATSGVIDFTGAIKPRGYFREALWLKKPVVHLGTELAARPERSSIDAWPIWNYESGAPVRVLCYMNAAKVRLLLNGKPVADEKPADKETGVVAWELPFQPGKLEAVALDATGREVARAAIATAGTPVTLKVTADRRDIARARGVGIISLQEVDQRGVPVLTDDDEVTCRVEGSARLLGLESGDNRDMSVATATTRRTYHGRLVAYVQALGDAGTVRVTFTRSGVPNATVALKAE